MPTPFYHLSVAETLLLEPGLAPSLRQFLRAQLPAFLLGHTAPDVQTVSGQARPETHFFDLPVSPHQEPPWDKFLRLYPGLTRAKTNNPGEAAFIAGYLCHLQADWLWIMDLYAPVFGPGQTWAPRQQRAFLHNVLRAYLDLQIVPRLDHNFGRELLRAVPVCWLPFVEDFYLQQWRDFLGNQLFPKTSIRTVEVFAARQGIPAQNYYRLLTSEERLDSELFARLPRQTLQNYRTRLIAANLSLLHTYFNHSGGMVWVTHPQSARRR